MVCRLVFIHFKKKIAYIIIKYQLVWYVWIYFYRNCIDYNTYQLCVDLLLSYILFWFKTLDKIINQQVDITFNISY